MEIVELRVHGVHGTSPGAMLGVTDGQVDQVAGDSLTGIYRAKPDVALPHRELAATQVSVEAYSWGALTSGVQGLLGWLRRALWLLLLPFALSNLAYWARLEVGRATGSSRWGARAVRVSGLLLTVFMVLTPCVVAIDMVAWQCYRYDTPGCTPLPDWLDFLAGFTASQRLAVGSLTPVLMIAVLWYLSRQSLTRYEQPYVAPEPIADEQAGVAPLLRDPHLWRGLDRTQRLQHLHLAVALAIVVAFSGLHLITVSPQWNPVWITTVAAGLLALASIFGVSVNHTTDLENKAPVPADPASPLLGVVNRCEAFGYAVGQQVRRRFEHRTSWLRDLALAVLVVHLALLWTYDGKVNQWEDFVGHNFWFIAVFALLTVLHLIVFAGARMPTTAAVLLVVLPAAGAAAGYAWLFFNNSFRGDTLALAVVVVLAYWLFLTAWHYTSGGHRYAAWRGAGASVLLAAAAWVALLFTSTLVVAAANYLNGPDASVGDLVSVTGSPAKPADTGEFQASGDVTVSDAYVVVSADGITILSGKVSVDGLAAGAPPDAKANGAAAGQGTTRIGGSATLRIPEEQVAFVDSCVFTANPERSEPCNAERRSFLTGGVLQTPDKTLTIQPGEGGEVVLEDVDPPQVPLVVPQVLIWTPLAQLAWLVIVGVALLIAVMLFSRTAGRKVSAALEDLARAGHPDAEIGERDRPAVAKQRAAAALAHRAERFLDIIGLVTAPVALLLIVFAASGMPPWDFQEWTRGFANLSMYVVIVLSTLVLLLGSQLRRSESARKAVGVIWDLTTFWPRAAHPLAPPCYAERVVPELQIRARWALDRSRLNRVILSGHSQGSLIVVAMASRLSDQDLARVRIITYGSQIRALYGRVFPCVFGARAIGYTATEDADTLRDPAPDVPIGPPATPAEPLAGSLRHRLDAVGNGNWVNLFRRSDPLGYRVFSDLDSDLDLVVPEVPREPLGDPGPAVMTHSGYQHSLRYRTVVHGWTGEPLQTDPTGTRNLPGLPPL